MDWFEPVMTVLLGEADTFVAFQLERTGRLRAVTESLEVGRLFRTSRNYRAAESRTSPARGIAESEGQIE
jgi:hypothetical protein